MPYVRDPVSLLFSPPRSMAAPRLLERAYASPGEWVTTPVAGPTLEHRTWALAGGINLDEEQSIGDNEPLNRWLRGYIRAVYWVHKWHYYESIGGLNLNRKRMAPGDSRGVRYRVGERIQRMGALTFATPVSIVVVAGGSAGYNRARRARRYIDNEAVRSVPELRDWA